MSPKVSSALFAFVLLTGCSSDGSDSVAPSSNTGSSAPTPNDVVPGSCDNDGTCPSETVTIDWWHALGGTLGDRLEEQVRTYNASQSAYRIQTRLVGNYAETLREGLAAFERDEHPTILQVYEVGTAEMQAAGVTLPVRSVMDRAGRTFDPDAYFPAIASFYSTPDGELLSLPYNTSTPVLFVNRETLAAAGLDETVPLRTWGDVEAVLRTLADRGHDCPMTTSWPSWIHLENLAAWHDQAFASEENGFAGTGAELLIDEPFFVQHVDRVDRWESEGLFVYSGRQSSGAPPFRAGDCALLTGSSGGFAGTVEEAQFDFRIAPLPHGDELDAPQNTIIGGASLWFMDGKDALSYQAAADFIDYLSSADVQARWHQATGYLPITPAAYELTRSQGFYDREPEAEIPVQQMLDRTPTPRTRGVRLGNFVSVRDVIETELESVWTGPVSAGAAMGMAVQRGNALLRNFERESGG